MNVYKFSIPDKNKNIFRCDVYDGFNNFKHHREVHVYDKNATEELNTLVIAKKMGITLGIDEQDLYVPVRMAVLIGESVWSNTKYSE